MTRWFLCFLLARLVCKVFLCVYFKDLERSIELSNNSFQRQLAAEKKKTMNSQEEVKILQEELDRLTSKLKVQHTSMLYSGS